MSRSVRKNPIVSAVGKLCRQFIKTGETGALRTRVRTQLTGMSELDSYVEPRRIEFGFENRTRECGKQRLTGQDAFRALRSK